jgi:heat shock protein HslJ
MRILLLVFVASMLPSCLTVSTSTTTGYVTKASQITGEVWELKMVMVKQKRVTPIKEHVPTLLFRKDGLVKGYSGLNKFYGRFILNPSLRTINLGSGFGKENNQGDPALKKQELGYFRVLKGDHEIYRSEDELFLNNQEKNVILFFKKQ